MDVASCHVHCLHAHSPGWLAGHVAVKAEVNWVSGTLVPHLSEDQSPDNISFASKESVPICCWDAY